MNDIMRVIGGAIAAVFVVAVVVGLVHISKKPPKLAPVVYHAPIPPDPPIAAPEPERAPEPSWVDAAPEYKTYSKVPLPPVKKKRRLHRKPCVCKAPAQVPGLLLPPFLVRP